MTRRAFTALFAFFFGSRHMQPNQYTVVLFPFAYSGTLDPHNPDQMRSPTYPENYYRGPEDQFFLPLVVGQVLEVRIDWESYEGFDIIIWDHASWQEWAHYVMAPELLAAPLQHEYFRWTVPVGVPPTVRLSVTASAGVSAATNYTLRIQEFGTAPSGGSGGGYGAF